MLTQELSRDVAKADKKFKCIDANALTVFGVAVVLLAVIFLAIYFR